MNVVGGSWTSGAFITVISTAHKTFYTLDWGRFICRNDNGLVYLTGLSGARSFQGPLALNTQHSGTLMEVYQRENYVYICIWFKQMFNPSVMISESIIPSSNYRESHAGIIAKLYSSEI